MNNICIIGAGVTGLSLLLLLQESGIDPSKIVVIDPHFDGGDLARKWTAIQSNTTLNKTTDAIAAACPKLPLQINYSTATTKLIDIIHIIRELATPFLTKVQQIQGLATTANYSSDLQRWSIHINAAGKPLTILSKCIVLAPGAEPKTLNLSIPSIPLEVAIDSSRLQHYITPGKRVVVFGTMHSGTIVIRNLVACGANVVAYYNSDKPFYWARDGDYDGIKEEAAQIADDIVSEKIPVEIISVKDISKLIRTSHSADWVVYAMGFQARDTIKLSIDDTYMTSFDYDGKTGMLRNIPAIWGFGVAFPNIAPDGIHWDVSVAAFIEHMKQQLPSILAKI